MVVTETLSTTTGEPARGRQSTWRRLLPSRTIGVRFSKFTAGSIFSTVLSELTLTGLYGIFHSTATVASVAAFIVGAIPNAIINWKWTWSRNGRPSIMREVLPYIVIIVAGGLAATRITSLTDHLLAPLVTNHALRTIALNVAYLFSYALLFVIKFALLNKVFGRKATAKAATTATTTATDSTATEPVAASAIDVPPAADASTVTSATSPSTAGPSTADTD